MPMTLVARIDRSPSHSISFYDSEVGVVVSETGDAEEMRAPAPLDVLRAQGIAATFRALAHDEHADVPTPLLAAEARWQARKAAAPAPVATTAPPEQAPAAATERRLARASGNQVTRDGLEEVTRSLGSLSSDAAWWQSLSICQSRNTTTGPYGDTIIGGWVDAVWCVTDVGWATTGWRDTMYYETTAFAQGNVATVSINKWINGAWQQIISQSVPYRYLTTFSFPPENGAYYQTFVTGTSGYAVGISERYRLAMPQPTFVSDKPNRVSYEFANDIDGITHDANSWFLTRSKYVCNDLVCGTSVSKYGLIAKVPLGTSLDDNPTGYGMPSSWTTSPGGGQRYNHFGDLVQVGGKLYVGVDGAAGGAIGVYDTNLNAKAIIPLSENWTAPLVAYNPIDGLFYVPDSESTFQKYSVNASTASATWEGTLHLSHAIAGPLQGGKFSPKGNLWIFAGGAGKNRQFWGVDGANGAVLIQGTLAPGNFDESEGLDIFDLDSETRPGMAGQLHIQRLQNNTLSNDSWRLSHWRAPMDRL
jgi:hypothetical protein